jgi:dTMP kinase
MTERGKYIVIEGSDGTGKSLQAVRLTERLQGLGFNPLLTFDDETNRMEPVQEPGGTPLANELRRRIKDKSIPRTPWQNVEWFTEARKSIWEEAIDPALEAGQPVITARSWISTMSYQGYGEGIDLDKIREYTLGHVGEIYMEPDYVCILAMKNERERRQRLMSRSAEDSEKDTFESMGDAFQQKMKNGYVRFARDNGIRLTSADGAPTDVERRIWRKVRGLFVQGA